MITRERAVEIIRFQLQQQDRHGHIELLPADKPDAYRVHGEIDIHEIGQAFEEATRWDHQ